MKIQYILFVILCATLLSTPPTHTMDTKKKDCYAIASNTANKKILIAAANGKLSDLRQALLEKADVDATDQNGTTALAYAAVKNQPSCLQELIANNASVNKENKWQDTPLISCADKGNITCLELLIKAQANINCSNVDGNTAVIRAADNGHDQCLALLIKHNASINTTNCHGSTALLLAAEHNHKPCVLTLLRSSFDRIDTNLAIRVAKLHKHTECLDLLNSYNNYHNVREKLTRDVREHINLCLLDVKKIKKRLTIVEAIRKKLDQDRLQQEISTLEKLSRELFKKQERMRALVDKLDTHTNHNMSEELLNEVDDLAIDIDCQIPNNLYALKNKSNLLIQQLKNTLPSCYACRGASSYHTCAETPRTTQYFDDSEKDEKDDTMQHGPVMDTEQPTIHTPTSSPDIKKYTKKVCPKKQPTDYEQPIAQEADLIKELEKTIKQRLANLHTISTKKFTNNTLIEKLGDSASIHTLALDMHEAGNSVEALAMLKELHTKLTQISYKISTKMKVTEETERIREVLEDIHNDISEITKKPKNNN